MSKRCHQQRSADMNTTEPLVNAERPRKPGELVFTGLLFAGSLAIAYYSFNISGLSSTSAPGSIPMMAAVFLLISSLFTLFKTAKMAKPGEDERFANLITPRIFLFYVCITLAYILTINQLGFLVSSLAFLFFSILILYRHGPLLSILISINVLAIIYVVFRLIFKVILPEASIWQ